MKISELFLAEKRYSKTTTIDIKNIKPTLSSQQDLLDLIRRFNIYAP